VGPLRAQSLVAEHGRPNGGYGHRPLWALRLRPLEHSLDKDECAHTYVLSRFRPQSPYFCSSSGRWVNCQVLNSPSRVTRSSLPVSTPAHLSWTSSLKKRCTSAAATAVHALDSVVGPEPIQDAMPSHWVSIQVP
jgi:hypothetical protein